VWSGNLPLRAGRALELAGVDVRSLVGADSTAPEVIVGRR
jgi:hypothetical protein